MNIAIQFKGQPAFELMVIPAFQTKQSEGKTQLDIKEWPSLLKNEAKKFKSFKNYKGDYQKTFVFPHQKGSFCLALGLGEKKALTSEKLRRAISAIFQHLKTSNYQTILWNLDLFDVLGDKEKMTALVTEAFYLTNYQFDLYKSSKNSSSKDVKKNILHFSSNVEKDALMKAFSSGKEIATGVNLARDFINEPPNVLNSVEFAKRVEADARKNLKGVKIKVLKKKDIEKEKMNLLLSVNRGSAFEPRVVHLTYTPKNVSSKTKHIALVGKGLTFDSGGYSLKPSSSMVGMKFDMAGAATVYGAFRNAVKLHSSCKISCFLGITDNMIAPFANVPDTIIKGRSGKMVEILNTDAEGRLVLADVLDYASSFKPHVMLDAATLTGACVRALGHVCGIMGNSPDLMEELLDAAKVQDERAWELPLIDEYRDDIKSTIADIKNIGGGSAGAQTAAAFLEHFVGKSIKWAHFDIAGVDTATHLPYCPKGSATGLMIRTLTGYLLDGGKTEV